MGLQVLFIGGTGQISLPCVQQAVEAGHSVTVLNRGSQPESLPPTVRQLTADFADDASYAAALAQQQWDTVCQFIAFTEQGVARDIRLLSGKAEQYIFISSASAYHKPVETFPITEEVPLVNPYWEYSRNKAKAESLLQSQSALPYTIVRPSHTLRTQFPTALGEGDTVLSRMLNGKPIIIPGDGQALWTLTRSEDFARPFVRLFGADGAINTAFHLTSDHAFPWTMIYQAVGRALGVSVDLVPVPSTVLAEHHPQWKEYLLGDKAYTVIFDNSKIKSVVGDFECARTLDEIMASPLRLWEQNGGAAQLQPSADLDDLIESIIG